MLKYNVTPEIEIYLSSENLINKLFINIWFVAVELFKNLESESKKTSKYGENHR